MLRLRLLGSVDLSGIDGRDGATVLAQPKRVALLAYLAAATPRGFHRRDALLPLLWPESDQPHARLALRQALHGIRAAVGAGAIVSRGAEEIGLDPAAECDVVEFDHAIAEGRLADGLDLYRGDLLHGFFVRDAPDFERWLEDERARLRAAATRAAADLADQCAERGAASDGIRHLRGALRLAPLDERLVRRLIALLDRMGDRAAALSAYDDFHARLAAELEVEPSPETLALVAAVRARAEAGPPDRLPEPAPAARGLPTGQREAVAGARVRRRLVVWSVAALGMAVLALGGWWRARSLAELDPHRVLVAPFANRTGDSTLTPLGGYAGDWIARGLALTGSLEIADASGARGEVVASQPPRSLARRARAGFVVWGTIDRRGRQVELAAHVSEVARSRQVQSLEPVPVDPADPRPALAMLRERLMTVLAQAVDQRFNDPGWVAVQPPRYDAYVAFATGLDLGYNQVDIPAALESLRQAAELDSSYALPLIHSALLSFYLGACDSAAALAGRLQQRPLTPIERWQVERELARCRGDFPASYRLSRRLVEASPGSDVMTFALIRDAMQIDRPREALEQSRRLDPERSVVRNRMSTHVFIATAYHWIGDHRRELRVAQGSRRLAATSDPAAPVRAELVALAALGRIPELNARLDAFSAIAAGAPTGFPPARRYAATVIRETALELTAHGHPREGAAALDRALAWLAARPAAEQATDYVVFERAQTLYAAGRSGSAIRVVEPLARAHPDNPDYVGLLGVLAAQAGDTATAARLDRALGTLERPLSTAAFWRACIAARQGARDRAVELLARARSEGQWLFQNTMNRRYFHVLGAHVEPSFDGLRGYPPFEALLRPKG